MLKVTQGRECLNRHYTVLQQRQTAVTVWLLVMDGPRVKLANDASPNAQKQKM